MVSKSDIAAVLSKYLQDLFDLPTEKLILNARLSTISISTASTQSIWL